MTPEQKELIMHLRAKGLSFGKIAATVGLSVNTVKSFCWRNRIDTTPPKYEDSPKAEYCAQCGSLLMQTPGHRQKRFCTNRCRRLWWKEHPESMNRKAYSPYTCQHCGKAFLQYGSRQRKFCSRKCYLTNRYEHIDAPDAE